MSILLWVIIVWIILIIFIIFWSYRYGMTIGAADYENIILLKKKEQRKELQEILEEEGIEKHR